MCARWRRRKPPKRAQTEEVAAQKYALAFAESSAVVDSCCTALAAKTPAARHAQRGRADLKQLGRRSSAPTSGKSVRRRRAFRPHRHHAVAAVEARGCEPNTVVSLIAKGYTCMIACYGRARHGRKELETTTEPISE